MSASAPPGPPPTLSDLKAMGVTGALITCATCQNSKALTWDEIGGEDDMPFPELSRRRFRCSACGGAEASVMPDWTGYSAVGRGRRD